MNEPSSPPERPHAGDRCCSPVVSLLPPPGSRRRRLWELEAHAHCSVVGVCLPIQALRRLVNKLVGGPAVADDYALHCGVIAECRVRTPVAEAVQKELDRRCALALQQARVLKTTDALAAWWQAGAAGSAPGRDLPGSFWATLTHPRCTAELQQQVLGEVHMLQHQVGMATRVELGRFEALIDENAVLGRELAEAQQRATRQATEAARRCDALAQQNLRSRAELITRTTELAGLSERLVALEAAVPELASRYALGQDNRQLSERVHALQRSLLQARQEADRQQRRAEEAEARAARVATLPANPEADAEPDAPLPQLMDRAVLCVGGRAASVPVYRQLIERTGGRFLHHDGGEEDNSARLETTLAAADLVICQTGCISHDAYWRVKDHCKRTGKRCLFVETPSQSALTRALANAAEP
ncbi:MAG: DUF2325 domain-containing protein [Rubrivivax sp.]|nr:DUF2325 domain-containing protein [Rubrivivax sp.]